MPPKQQQTGVGNAALLPIKNALYLGNYGVAISKAPQISVSSEDAVEKDVLVYRAHIGLQQYDIVLDEVKDSDQTPIALRAVRALAQYYNSSDKQAVVDKLDAWFQDPTLASDTTLAIVAATIYSLEGNLNAALKVVYNPSTLELASLQVTTLLQVNRIDLAQEALKVMQEMNDDATITQLTTAYVSLAKGGDKLQEAQNIFGELADKFGDTVILLNGLALCQIVAGQYQDAETSLVNALGKKSNDPDTLINLITCAQHTRKSKDTVQRYMNQLKSAAPNHAWLKSVTETEAQFDKFASKYKAKQ